MPSRMDEDECPLRDAAVGAPVGDPDSTALGIRDGAAVGAGVTCGICLADFSRSDRAAAPHCGHVFHKECLSTWRDRSRTCPK